MKHVSCGDDYEWGTDLIGPADTLRVITGEDAVSDLDTYCVMTDRVLTNSGREIGIEVTQRTYAWRTSYLDDFIIYDLTFKNIGAVDLRECYVGFAMDCDVSKHEGSGHSIYDVTSWDPENLISYMYDADNPEVPGDDTGGPTGLESPGYMGTIPLFSPPASDGRAPADHPSSHYWWDWNHDPAWDESKYAYMASGMFLETPSPFDHRYLQSYGPYDISAGGSIRIVVAMGVGEGLVGLQENLLAAKELFMTNRDTEGKWIVSSDEVPVADAEADQTSLKPETYGLSQNTPNPFNPITMIPYDLPKASDVTLTIYSVTGQQVATVVSGHQEAGHSEVMWDGSSFATGVYLYRLEAGDFVKTRRMLLLK